MLHGKSVSNAPLNNYSRDWYVLWHLSEDASRHPPKRPFSSHWFRFVPFCYHFRLLPLRYISRHNDLNMLVYGYKIIMLATFPLAQGPGLQGACKASVLRLHPSILATAEVKRLNAFYQTTRSRLANRLHQCFAIKVVPCTAVCGKCISNEGLSNHWYAAVGCRDACRALMDITESL